MKKYRLISLGMAVVGVLTMIAGCTMLASAKDAVNANVAEKAAAEQHIRSYYDTADNNGLFKVYREYELTNDMLTNRKGTIIVETVIGRCIDGKSGAGVIIGKEHEQNNYISYKGVKGGIKTNDIVCSYFIYNPDNNYEDDIIERYDFVIESSN